MNQKIRNHFDQLFKNAPKTRAALELKEELLANCNERYEDLLASGITENDAYEAAVNAIGDVDQLIASLQVDSITGTLSPELMKKIALYKTIAIALFIMAVPTNMIISDLLPYSVLSDLVLFTMITIGVCILVYVNAAYPKYQKKEDTLVEDFKEWNNTQKHSKAVLASVSAIIWLLTTIAFFVVSFTTYAWHITWVIFLVGACLQSIATLLFHLKQISDKER